MWLCKCDCGSETKKSSAAIGRTITCSRQCPMNLRNKTHGHTAGGKQSPTYISWASMVSRCTNPNTIYYENYGGRGIEVCNRWHKFENFLADMSVKPRGMTLDRINNDGNYEPDNCRWATVKEQANNTRNNTIAQTSRGPLTLSQIADATGLDPRSVHRRYRRGCRGDELLLPRQNTGRKRVT